MRAHPDQGSKVRVEFGAAHCSRSLAVAHCCLTEPEPSVHFMQAEEERVAPGNNSAALHTGPVVELALSCHWKVPDPGCMQTLADSRQHPCSDPCPTSARCVS